jgi:hypothetical protein
MNELVQEVLDNLATPEPNSGCYLWDGTVDKDGYGKLKRGGVDLRAHRYVYQLVHRYLPDDMLVCHSCDVPSCINPAHLFLGTCAENLADMSRKGKYRNNRMLREFCPNGHRRTEENTYLFRGKQLCRDCRAQNDLARYARDGDKRRQAAMDYYWKVGKAKRNGQ